MKTVPKGPFMNDVGCHDPSIYLLVTVTRNIKCKFLFKKKERKKYNQQI